MSGRQCNFNTTVHFQLLKPTLLHLHPAQQQYCFLSESWPVEKSPSGDQDTSQTHADTTLSASQTQRGVESHETRLILGCYWPCRGTSLGWLRLENTRRGQDRWWCLEIQLRIFSHSAVPLGGGPSSLCSNTSCFWARTALPSSICSSCRRKRSMEGPPGSLPDCEHQAEGFVSMTLLHICISKSAYGSKIVILNKSSFFLIIELQKWLLSEC